jgi:hypothetical protein
MEGVLLAAGSVAMLVGIGVLVEAARCRHGSPGRKPVLARGEERAAAL